MMNSFDFLKVKKIESFLLKDGIKNHNFSNIYLSHEQSVCNDVPPLMSY